MKRDAAAAAWPIPGPPAIIVSAGCTLPPFHYGQDELLAAFGGSDDVLARRLTRTSGIKGRYLVLDRDALTRHEESHEILIQRHCSESVRLGAAAFHAALRRGGLHNRQIEYLCCVTSTGFLLPGLTALLTDKLDLSSKCQRLDVVGMGCSAGVNALSAVASWCRVNPGRYGAVVCSEVNSAMRSLDASRETLIINALFGDAAAAMIVQAQVPEPPGWEVVGFESLTVATESNALRFEWDRESGKWRLRLSRELPKIVAYNLHEPLTLLLDRFGLTRRDVRFWMLHGGGPALITVFRKELGLDSEQLKPTTSVLRDCGNLSSASFVFTLLGLWDAGQMVRGDPAIIIAVGPGIALELALIRWR